jgi:outer membrane protein TolC
MKTPLPTAAIVTFWLSSGFLSAALFSGGCLLGQTQNQSSAQSPYYGSVTTLPATDQVKQLSIDDAIRMGIQYNLALVEARAQERAEDAQILERLQPLLPTITGQGDLGAHEYNLAAFGFTRKLLPEFATLIPGLNPAAFTQITKANVADAQINYSQTLFSLSSIDQYRAAKAEAIGAYFNTQSSRGLTVLNVGTAYLQALAAGAHVDDAKALLAADQLLLDQTVAQHKAGTVANLDELRARVQMQSQEQNLIVATNDFEKAKIALNREIGLAPEQKIQLTDASPYSDLAEMGIQEAQQTAYKNRQDYQGIQARIRAAQLQLKAAKWERLPSLEFDGNYGVTAVFAGVSHGTFVAAGSLNVPLFQEAKFRGDRQVASSNLNDLLDQFSNLRRQIDEQLRDSLLDVQTTAELVRVARSNVELAHQVLDQTTERFQAGVEDNLPVVQAQASLAAAESNLVDTTVQFNEAKLGLARNLGIVDTQYKTFLHAK